VSLNSMRCRFLSNFVNEPEPLYVVLFCLAFAVTAIFLNSSNLLFCWFIAVVMLLVLHFTERNEKERSE